VDLKQQSRGREGYECYKIMKIEQMHVCVVKVKNVDVVFPMSMDK